MISVRETGRWNFKADPIDMTGERHGRLVVVRRVASDGSGRARWLCRCDCGTECNVRADNLTTGKVRSCGCLRVEKGAEKAAAMRAALSKAGTHFVDCWQLPGHEACAVVQMRRIRGVVNEQAWNEGLWFRAEHVTEDYLQCALRRLHAVIEGEG